PISTLFPYTTLFRSRPLELNKPEIIFNMRKFLSSITEWTARYPGHKYPPIDFLETFHQKCVHCIQLVRCEAESSRRILRHPCWRSEEHTSELQSREN